MVSFLRDISGVPSVGKRKMSTMNLRSSTRRKRKTVCSGCTSCSSTVAGKKVKKSADSKQTVTQQKNTMIKPADPNASQQTSTEQKPDDSNSSKQTDNEQKYKMIKKEPTLILEARVSKKPGEMGLRYWSRNSHHLTVQYEGHSAEIEIVAGDITKETVNAIVNSTTKNLDLQAGGAVSKRILAKGGPIIQTQCDHLGHMVNDVASTGGGQLKCDRIIHLNGSKDSACWSDIIKKGLLMADRQLLTSIAFPVLGTGARRESTQFIAEVMSKTFREYIFQYPDNLQLIRIVVFQPQMVEEFKQTFLAEVKGKTKLVEKKNFSSDDTKINEMLPVHWYGNDEDLLVREVTLKETCQEYKNVYNKFTSTVTNLKQMISIKRIQNPVLYCQFMLKKRMLEKTLGEKCTQVVRELWHGTAAENINDIIRNGFDRNYAGTNHGIGLGKGVYFAKDAVYSTSPRYAKKSILGHQNVYLAQVLTGEYTKGTRELLVPPTKNSESSSRYESTVDNMDNPEMFAIFNDTQMYPEYLLTFSVSDQLY